MNITKLASVIDNFLPTASDEPMTEKESKVLAALLAMDSDTYRKIINMVSEGKLCWEDFQPDIEVAYSSAVQDISAVSQKVSSGSVPDSSLSSRLYKKILGKEKETYAELSPEFRRKDFQTTTAEKYKTQTGSDVSAHSTDLYINPQTGRYSANTEEIVLTEYDLNDYKTNYPELSLPEYKKILQQKYMRGDLL